jgi:hypothetical protein
MEVQEIKTQIMNMVKQHGAVRGSYVIETLAKKNNVLNREIGTQLSKMINDGILKIKMINGSMLTTLV